MSDRVSILLVGVSLAVLLFGGAVYTHLDWKLRQYRARRHQQRKRGMIA